MNSTEILLSTTTSSEEKYQAANNIINFHKLFLKPDQILQASQSVRADNFKNIPIILGNRIFLLNKLLNENINMYIALTLALCDGYESYYLSFLVTRSYVSKERTMYTGSDIFVSSVYCKLL